MLKHIKKGISFLTEPGKSFDAEKKTSLNDAFKYVLVLAIIVAVLGAIVSTISFSFATGFIPPEAAAFVNAPGIFVMGLVIGYVGLIVFLVIWGLWLHLWVYFLGAKNGLQQTMKAVFYGFTPNYLLGWIPIINFITLVWSYVLMGMGIVKYQGMTGGKAAVAIIIAILIPVIIGLAILAAFLIPMMTAFSAFQPGTIPGY